MKRAEALLQQFPGPVTLRSSPAQWLPALLFMLILGGFSLAMSIIGAFEGFERAFGFFGGVFFLACSYVPIVRMRAEQNSLTLDVEGSEWRHPNNQGRLRWVEVGAFSTWTAFLLDDIFDTANVEYELADPTDPDRTGGLSERYGLKGRELAYLMTEWRSRALDRRN